MKKVVITSLVILSIVFLYMLTTRNEDDNDIQRNHSGSIYDNAEYDDLSYHNYKTKYPEIYPQETIIVDVTDNFEYKNGLFEDNPYVDTFIDDDNLEKKGLYVPETGNISFHVDVETAGYYNIKIYYYTIEGRSAAISKGIMINDEYPFIEASNIFLSRIWKDKFLVSDRRKDGEHDFKPGQEEVRLWVEETVRDREGYYNESYKFYFEENDNKITFISHREPVVIEKIELYQEKDILPYEEIKSIYDSNGYKEITKVVEVTTQGENAYQKSSPILSPIANFSSYKVEPYVKFLTRYNTIGGINWRIAGDWITWEVNVDEEGLYNLSFKALQNFNRGMSSTRTLYVNGEIPFEEAKTIEFPYSSDWQYITVGEKDNPYLIHLKQGINTITLQASIGVYGDIVRNVEETISDLRDFYREVVMKTGLNPDPYQDYLLSKYIRDLDKRIDFNINNLENAKQDVINIAGERSGLISAFDRTLYQLKQFKKSEKNIQTGLKELDQNISSLGTWVMTVSEQPLLIDLIKVHSKPVVLKEVRTNFFEKVWHEIVMFIGSFGAGGSLDSSVDLDGPTITVWMTTGRDQAKIMRQMIDESFSVEKNINVDLKLVTSGVLLPATLSGNGPDVAIGVGENIPVNWGIRNAIQDLSQFDDFESVSQEFHISALTPFTFGNSVYALPDTQDFLMTFYREDILKEIGLKEPPSTWNDVIDTLPVLQNKFLDYYIPNVQGALNPVLYSMIEQYGGSLYLEDGKYSGLMQEESTKAFIDFTKLYSDNSFVLSANFVNRFRSGEMPIGVSYYTDYNIFSVFAPEINGSWSYAPIPGVIDENGNLINTTTSRTSGTVLMKSSTEKMASWEFIKWWLGADTQLNYARNMEAILGAAARYPTANLKAFEQLPWPTKDYIVLKEQRENSKGIPIVPGDYIVGRYIDNAFRSSINNGINPYDSLYVYHLKIDQELTRKRKEFGL